jgi:predicted transcriptional regulator
MDEESPLDLNDFIARNCDWIQAALDEAEEDVRLGRVYPAEEVLDRLQAKAEALARDFKPPASS